MVQIIRIAGRCNQNCIFCCQTQNRNSKDVGSEELFNKYVNMIRSEKKHVILSGSETTLYPRIFDLISFAKENCDYVELQSNGITFSYKTWAKKFFDFGIDEFNINFPSHIKKTAATITRTENSFEKRLEGVKNLSELGANIRLTYVITSLNYMEMPGFVSFINSLFSNITVIFTYLQNAGNAKNNLFLFKSYSEISSYLNKALDIRNEKHNTFLAEGIPACFLKEHKEKIVDFRKKESNTNFFPIISRKIAACIDCKENQFCQGIPRYYLDIYDEKEIIGLK
jgi:MoaA/NifB/PqqE/SkfB family radical SAM enzyme